MFFMLMLSIISNLEVFVCNAASKSVNFSQKKLLNGNHWPFLCFGTYVVFSRNLTGLQMWCSNKENSVIGSGDALSCTLL